MNTLSVSKPVSNLKQWYNNYTGKFKWKKNLKLSEHTQGCHNFCWSRRNSINILINKILTNWTLIYITTILVWFTPLTEFKYALCRVLSPWFDKIKQTRVTSKRDIISSSEDFRLGRVWELIHLSFLSLTAQTLTRASSVEHLWNLTISNRFLCNNMQ